MESQQQQPQVDDINSSEVITALEPAPQAQLSPTTQSLKKGQWIVTQIFVFFTQLFDNLGSFFNTYKQLIIVTALVLGAIVALRIVLAVMDALNDIPLLAPTFQLIGISYSIWFVNRFLLGASKRQELAQILQGLLNQQESETEG